MQYIIAWIPRFPFLCVPSHVSGGSNNKISNPPGQDRGIGGYTVPPHTTKRRAATNCAAMNIGVRRFFWIGVSGFLGYNPSSQYTGSQPHHPECPRSRHISEAKQGQTWLVRGWEELPFDPVIPLLGLYPGNPESPTQKNLWTSMFIAALFIIAKCWEQPKCPSVNEWIKNCGTFTLWNTTQQKERRSSYPSQQPRWNWRALCWVK